MRKILRKKRERGRQADTPTVRQTNTDRQMDKQTYIPTDRQR